MKIDRLVSILMMLINKDKVTANELADKFEVSIRTIQRDMDHLNMAGVPIYAEVGKNGGYQLMEEYKLNKNFLNTQEAKVFASLVDNIYKTIPEADVGSICNKFKTLLPEEKDEQKLVIRLNPQLNQKRIREKLEILTKARDMKNMVRMNYIDAKFDKSERLIEPYTLVMMGTIWYVYGYCRLREDFRMFKLNRITEYQVLEEQFEPRVLPEDIPWEINFNTPRPCTPLVLDLDLCMVGRVTQYFDHENCQLLDDRIRVTVNYPVDEWLYSYLAGLIPHVKIVEPAFVREEFIRRIKESIEKNKL